MAEPLITPTDIATAFDVHFDSESAELKQLMFFIRFASGKARHEVNKVSAVSLDQGIEDGTVDRDLMVGTLVVVVMRALDAWRRGPDVSSRAYVEETTEYVSSPQAMSLVWFADDEIATLVPQVSVGGSGSEAFSIRFGPA